MALVGEDTEVFESLLVEDPPLSPVPPFFEPLTNRFPDPDFESGALRIDHTAVIGASTAPLVRLTAPTEPVIGGRRSLLLGWTAAHGTGPDADTEPGIVQTAINLPEAEGAVISVGVDVAFKPAGHEACLAVRFLTDTTDPDTDYPTGSRLEQHIAASPATAIATPGRLWIENLLAPPLTAVLQIVLGLRRTSASGSGAATATFDRVMLVDGQTLPTAFLHGEQGGAQWDGPRWHSTSSRRGEAEGMAHIKTLVPPFWYVA